MKARKYTEEQIIAVFREAEAGAYLNVSGFRSGVYFDHWDIHNLMPVTCPQ